VDRPQTGEITVHEWWQRWFPAQNKAPNMLQNYAQQYGEYIRPRWGDIPLRALTQLDKEP
jgi:hypothetical protein